MKYNLRNHVVGDGAKDLQNYLVLQAHTRVPINIPDWRKVPPSINDNLWQDVNVRYSNFITFQILDILVSLK